jgi:predicted O-methyltransferase YrrM
MESGRWSRKDSVKLFVPPIVLNAYRGIRDLFRPEVKTQLPTYAVTELFPGIERRAVSLPVSQLPREGGFLPLQELLTLAAICRYVNPQSVFEIGTYRGGSTLIMAMHSAASTTIHTLDLPAHDSAIQYPLDIGPIAGKPFIVGERYRGTEFASRIHQLYEDSAKFDFTPYYGTVDLVLVDGNHEYGNVKMDSEHAFKMLRPGGVIVWDDYHISYGPGVIRALHDYSDRHLFQIAGTRFAVYKDGA